MSFSHAAILNVSNLARECQVERKVAEGYVEMLSDLLLAFTLPVFTRRARRRMTTHPKIYLVDAGLFHSLRPTGPLDRPEELAGVALEGLVAQHLRAWIAYSNRDDTLSFWRTRAGNEVDFVLYGESGLYAIEVKSSATLHPRDFSGRRAFTEDYPVATPVLLYRGPRRLRERGVLCLPCEPFSPYPHPVAVILGNPRIRARSIVARCCYEDHCRSGSKGYIGRRRWRKWKRVMAAAVLPGVSTRMIEGQTSR